MDCDNYHKVFAQDDKSIKGVLTVKSCKASRFDRKPSRGLSIGKTFNALLAARAKKLGMKDPLEMKLVKSGGGPTYTEFTYTLSCDKSRQQAIIDSLKEACKDKALSDKINEEKQRDDDESSSESDEEDVPKPTGRSTAKATTKAAKATKATTNAPKVTTKVAKATEKAPEATNKATKATKKASGKLQKKFCPPVTAL